MPKDNLKEITNIPIGEIIKIKWAVGDKGETLHALGAVYRDLGPGYMVVLNQISRNTHVIGANPMYIDKDRVVGIATDEDILNFKKCM